MILRKDTIAVVATMVVWVVCAQVDLALSQSPRLSAQSVGAGRWQSSRDHLGERDWQVQITRFAGALLLQLIRYGSLSSKGAG